MQDASRRQVDASSSVPVYAAGIRLGMRTSVVSAPLGSNISVELRVVDLDGKPAAAKVTLEIQGQVWDRKANAYKTKSFGATSVDVPATGKAMAKVPAKDRGRSAGHSHRLRQHGSQDGNIDLRMGRWTWNKARERRSSTKGRPWESSSTVRATPPVTTSRPGWQPTPSIALCWSPPRVSTSGVTKSSRRGVVSTTGGLKASVEMSPNAFIEVAQWTKVGMVSATADVPIPDNTRELAVSIKPERTAYRPGEPANYTIRTTGKDGKPVSAEVSVAVVDESIYAMRPDSTRDLLTTFWAARQNGVSTHVSAPEEVSGGAYQRVNSLAPARQRFVDTAYWSAHVMTGADGAATISFETPGNLTTWRATARAITTDTRVGTGSITTQASRPVMLRLATPRQLVKGDKLKLIGTVANRSGVSREFETAISAVGVRIEGDLSRKIKVENGKEGTVEWTVIADTLSETGAATITARTLATDAKPDEGEELSDALKVDVRVGSRRPPAPHCHWRRDGAGEDHHAHSALGPYRTGQHREDHRPPRGFRRLCAT